MTGQGWPPIFRYANMTGKYMVVPRLDMYTHALSWAIVKKGSNATIAKNYRSKAEADIACARFNEGKPPTKEATS